MLDIKNNNYKLQIEIRLLLITKAEISIIVPMYILIVILIAE